MDVKHIDMQFLGIFGIFKETFKIINKNKKIFATAALCFIHPLNYILSSFIGILDIFFTNLLEHGNLSYLFPHNRSVFFWLVNVFFIIFLFGYSIYSTAGVSLTVVTVYAGRETSNKDTSSVVAKVWKRVLVTFLCVLLVVLVFHMIAGFAFYLIVWSFGEVNDHGKTLSVFLVVFYFVGLLYLVVVLQLAGIVSSLEESCGFKAMAKSRLLLKGKMASATIVVSVILSSLWIILWLDSLVGKMPYSPWIIIWIYVLMKLLMLFLILVFLLWMLVLGTVLYFVCKSYHRESIDMPALFDQYHI